MFLVTSVLTPVGLQKPLHDSCGSLVLAVDLIEPRAGRPAHLGGPARGVDLVADPSEGSHRPVKLLLVLQAIPS